MKARRLYGIALALGFVAGITYTALGHAHGESLPLDQPQPVPMSSTCSKSCGVTNCSISCPDGKAASCRCNEYGDAECKCK